MVETTAFATEQTLRNRRFLWNMSDSVNNGVTVFPKYEYAQDSANLRSDHRPTSYQGFLDVPIQYPDLGALTTYVHKGTSDVRTTAS